MTFAGVKTLNPKSQEALQGDTAQNDCILLMVAITSWVNRVPPGCLALVLASQDWRDEL